MPSSSNFAAATATTIAAEGPPRSARSLVSLSSTNRSNNSSSSPHRSGQPRRFTATTTSSPAAGNNRSLDTNLNRSLRNLDARYFETNTTTNNNNDDDDHHLNDNSYNNDYSHSAVDYTYEGYEKDEEEEEIDRDPSHDGSLEIRHPNHRHHHYHQQQGHRAGGEDAADADEHSNSTACLSRTNPFDDFEASVYNDGWSLAYNSTDNNDNTESADDEPSSQQSAVAMYPDVYSTDNSNVCSFYDDDDYCEDYNDGYTTATRNPHHRYIDDDYDDEEEDVEEDESDPRSAFFRLLDLHCSVQSGEDDDYYHDYDEGSHGGGGGGSGYDTSNHKTSASRNDWDPIREWIRSLMPDDDDNNDDDNNEAAVLDLDGDIGASNGRTNSRGRKNNNKKNNNRRRSRTEDPERAAREHHLRTAVLEARGGSGQTVLHAVCERSVPIDVLELLLSVSGTDNDGDGGNHHDANDAGSISNSYHTNNHLARCATIDGWLPLHYACNYPNDYAVVERLVEAYPEAKIVSDRKGRTPLHFAMREENFDTGVVALLAGAAGISDDNGILPLHYACLYGATEEFLRILTEAYPEGIAARDRFGRVPLHYSLSNAGKPNAPGAVRLLLDSEPDLVNIPGIARVFSGSDAVRKYAVSARSTENKLGGGFGYGSGYGYGYGSSYGNGGTTQGNGASASAAASAVLATKEVFSSEAVEECLKRFLEAKPEPTADFFTALQSLPESLREKAVLMRVVQELLNKKIGQRFPTALLLLDLYLQAIVVVCYTLVIRDSIRWRFRDAHRYPVYDASGSDDDVYDFEYLGFAVGEDTSAEDYSHNTIQKLICFFALYTALVYFLFREIVQIIGLISLKASWIWVGEPGNWVNVTYIAWIGAFTVLATTGGGDDEVFRNGAALSFAIIWSKFLSYLRKILIDFSVFSGGVFHVLRRLLAFLMCLTIILIAFSRMFFTLFYQTDYCKVPSEDDDPDATTTTIPPTAEFPFGYDFDFDVQLTKDLICEANDTDFPWCNAWDSFLAVYTMLLGEVDETIFGDEDGNNSAAIFLFLVFMLLVVILLANVLIAIVTDSYKVIRDKRAAIVFWTNRLDFIAQMDAIANGPWKSRLGSRFANANAQTNSNNKHSDNNGDGVDPDITNNNNAYSEATFGKDLWNDIVELFEHETLAEDGVFSLDFCLCGLLRLLALLVVPIWILVGALSAGLLWPPQVRERLFVGAITTTTSSGGGSESEKEETRRRTQIENLKGEIALLKHDLDAESVRHRTQIVQMKSAVAERRLETLNTLSAIKKNVVLALELCEIGREEARREDEDHDHDREA